jgi:hypothetical protein
MSISIFACAAALIGFQGQLQTVYESFNYAPNSALIGQTHPNGLTWLAAGSGPEQPGVQIGNLQVPGLAAPAGHKARIRPGSGPSARLPFGGAVNNGVVFFSFAMKVPDVAGLGTGTDFIAAFTPSDVAQANTPTNGFTRLFLRSLTGGYQLGLSKSSSLAGNIAWDAATFGSNDTVFVVGSYSFTDGPGNDTARLWINPSATTFGSSDAPAPTLTATTGPDVNQLASFVFFQRPGSILPALLQLDELRIASTWGEVTPVSLPPPRDFGDAPDSYHTRRHQ